MTPNLIAILMLGLGRLGDINFVDSFPTDPGWEAVTQENDHSDLFREHSAAHPLKRASRNCRDTPTTSGLSDWQHEPRLFPRTESTARRAIADAMNLSHHATVYSVGG